MIAGHRGLGLPAAYVSVYLRTYPPAGKPRLQCADATHAWVSVWCGNQIGWIGFDPTNGCQVNDNFVKVAVGRDFTDVPPNKGVYRGEGQETISVRVATRELERLPSVSWQEQLPPLDIPMTAIARRSRPSASSRSRP